MDLSLILSLLLTIWVQNSFSAETCGQEAQDPTKTCISIRLPWQEAPIFFCQPKEVFKFRNECRNRNSNLCNFDAAARNDTLAIITPWDCCPLISYPFMCNNIQCAPPPLNRKCREIQRSEMEGSYDTSFGLDDCCPKYFCEDTSPKDCHFKRLEPGCTQPPKDKMNCIGFYDQYACCPTWQCDGDNMKPGYCPAQLVAMRFNSLPNLGGSPPPGQGQGPEAGSAKPEPEPSPEPVPAQMTRIPSLSIFMANLVRCISDDNCPESQKCCSNDPFVYSDGRFLHRNSQPTYGYCTEPSMPNQQNPVTPTMP